jgi:hypothetical protein
VAGLAATAATGAVLLTGAVSTSLPKEGLRLVPVPRVRAAPANLICSSDKPRVEKRACASSAAPGRTCAAKTDR